MKTFISLRVLTWSILVILPLGLMGCSNGPPPPTDPGEAVALLKSVLEAWKSGRTIESLKDGSPSITVVDTSWTSGSKLVQFEIDEAEAKPSGYDLACPVKLWIGDAKKAPLKIKYVIALKPVKVVTRDFGG